MNQQQDDQTNVVKGLVAHLPPKSFNILYRDDIGNVSTSTVKGSTKQTLLQLKPRYPLFGGWKYKWHHGYDVSLSSFMKREAGNKHVLRLPFTGALKNITVEKMIFELVLPEGAT